MYLDQSSLPPRPTKFALFLRQNILWQCYRFLVINYKMIKTIIKSH